MDELLSMQTTWLNAEVVRLEGIVARLPVPEERNWVGDARAVYALNVVRLHSEAQTALGFLRAALAQTARAMETVGDRG